MKRVLGGDRWTTREQELLLRATVEQGSAATEAFREWCAMGAMSRVDLDAERILPLLYLNLRRQGLQHPLMDELRRRYRHTWLRNESHFQRIAEELNCFQQAGIETMVLKGAALVSLYYKDHGSRLMGDVDVLVPTHKAEVAMQLLTQRGWHPKLKQPERMIRVLHAAEFGDANNGYLDLHWHLLWEACEPDADEDFWAGSVPIQFGSARTRALNPTDQLFHLCAHGALWDPYPVLRWVTDALAVLNSAEIDYERLMRHMQRQQLVLPLQDTLSYLRERWNAPILPDKLRAIQDLPASPLERMEYNAKQNLPQLLAPIPLHWTHYLRMSRRDSRANVLGFARYIQQLWGVEHMWQLPATVAIRVTNRFTKNVLK